MKAELHGYWIDVELYNTDLWTAGSSQKRMDSDVYETYLTAKRKELESLFRSDKWFDISRNSQGVADTWGSEDLYKEFIPFLVWNSENNRPEFVDERWKETNLYNEISWNSKYTKMKGINI